jgi:hypothetical protein
LVRAFGDNTGDCRTVAGLANRPRTAGTGLREMIPVRVAHHGNIDSIIALRREVQRVHAFPEPDLFKADPDAEHVRVFFAGKPARLSGSS